VHFQWHPELHRQWGKERLAFWRMGFSPTYDRSQVKQRLLDLFSAQDVNSYAFYEMIGIHDLMLRLWLPTSMTLSSFDSELKAALQREGILMTEYFAVDETLAHWVWTDKSGRPRPVNKKILEHGIPDETLTRINRATIKREERKSYEGLDVIAPSGHVKGIKFFVIVTTGTLPVYLSHDEPTLSERISKILHDADSILEKSLYMGSGGLGQFLIMGKVKPPNFDKIFTELIEPINNLGLKRNLRARTYTHICTTGLVDFVDILPPWQDVVRDSEVKPIGDYLREEESRKLEVKGSAFVKVENWISTGKRKFDRELLFDGVLRTIVGMLNSEGGAIVIGALEAREPFISASKEGGPLADCPNFEDRYLIYGLEADYHVSGSTKNWDSFVQRLNGHIGERITPQAHPWVTIDDSEFMGKPMAVLSVREPDSAWFYLRDGNQETFHVRQENQTVILGGAKADEYKRAKRRI
jgi:hypothetical protein